MNDGKPMHRGDQQIAAVRPEAVEILADLLRQFGGKVSGHLRKRFPGLSNEERYDVLVDALVAFARSYDPQRGPEGPWLLLLAHQRAIDHLRCEPGQRLQLGWNEPDQYRSRELSPPAHIEQDERVSKIHEAIARLAPTERAVIEADLEVGGAANANRLAAQLETSSRAVYAARARAREKLTRWLSDGP